MHNLLGYGRWDYVMAYLDDILIFSRTFDEHIKHLNEILSILAEVNFQVNPDKCFIAVQEIDFLGHTINAHSIKPNGEKIKAIIHLPSPKTLKEANEFLGKINWYRKFIPNFARIAAPLHKVTNKTKHRRHEYRWGPEQQQSFEEFKHILTTSPLFLEYPDLSTPFTLTTDASDIGIAGILRQDTPAGTKINYFKSRVLNDTERKYDTFEKEALAIYWCITELRSYIGDSNFIVETDHRPLENFHLKQINNKRANNTAADYISRYISSSTSGDTTPPGPTNTLHSHTCDNTELNAVTTRAQAKLLAQPRSSTSIAPESTRSSPSASTQSYDFSLSRILRRDNTVLKFIYTPATLIPDLLTAYHDHPLSGHFGIGRTWSQLRNTYYWPRMKETIMSYIKSCDKCSQFNVDRRKPPGFLQPIQPPNDVFQILGMDWWGPTVPSLSGNRYVLVVTDRLFGYVFATASPTNTAQDTARILMEKIILVHGPPDILITDQGTHFKNELLQAISKLVGCTHVFSTPYHPQTNGQTERWNSTFVTQLAKFCNIDQNNWDIFLPCIVYAYNNGIHNSTGFTPYQLAFGRQPRHPFTPPDSTFVFNKPHDYWMQLLKYRNLALKQAKQNILHQQQVSKTRFDKNRSHPYFVPGDLVWMKIFMGRNKLDAQYTGPVRIIQVLSPVSFLVEDDNFRRFQIGTPLRPIVAAIHGPAILISKYLDDLLRPVFKRIARRTIYNDSLDLVKQLERYDKDGHLTSTTKFITSDILTALFLTINIIKPIRGDAMGSPFTTTSVNIYMHQWKQSLIQHQQERNELYRRYIDDIFMTTKESIEDIKVLLDQENQKDPNIRINYSVHKSVEFLDVYIENIQGHLKTSVFRKPAAEPYIHSYTSDHPRHIHSNTIYTALLRAICICSDTETFDQERLNIEIALLFNGYPPKFIRHHFKKFFKTYHATSVYKDLNEEMHKKLHHELLYESVYDDQILQ
ncbi:unnamed protein product [Rotaria sordida]|nr:unnamed protein product [Rotaria sordida]CAF1445061.1 unnamed protein product [Rotaria sordida]